jgi:hypothetical protein
VFATWVELFNEFEKSIGLLGLDALGIDKRLECIQKFLELESFGCKVIEVYHAKHNLWCWGNF